MQLGKGKLIAIVAITAILNSFIDGGIMYLVDSTWVDDKVERKKDQLDNKMIRYLDALDVSQQMVDNCYEAFYTVSECSKGDGCDFAKTIDSLTDLNVERKILRQKRDQLLDSENFSWSKNRPL